MPCVRDLSFSWLLIKKKNEKNPYVHLICPKANKPVNCTFKLLLVIQYQSKCTHCTLGSHSQIELGIYTRLPTIAKFSPNKVSHCTAFPFYIQVLHECLCG